MAGVGGIGAAGVAGGVGMSVGGAGPGMSAVAAPAAAPAGAAQAGASPSVAGEGVKVTISQAGQRMSMEATQVGASFSVTSDIGGHQYVAGMDADGFRSPDAVSPTHNANGQSYAELNKLDDMLAAALLALLLGQRDDKDSGAAGLVAAATAVQAVNAYAAVSKM